MAGPFEVGWLVAGAYPFFWRLNGLLLVGWRGCWPRAGWERCVSSTGLALAGLSFRIALSIESLSLGDHFFVEFAGSLLVTGIPFPEWRHACRGPGGPGFQRNVDLAERKQR
jgi:hypothetical protein